MGQWEIRGIIRAGGLPQLVNAPISSCLTGEVKDFEEDFVMTSKKTDLVKLASRVLNRQSRFVKTDIDWPSLDQLK
jgi:hypothetical protein